MLELDRVTMNSMDKTMVKTKIKKCGFTLAEALIALAVISVITVLGLTILKPEKKAVRYAYINAYNSLNKAYYNGTIKGYNPFGDEDKEGNEFVHTDNNDTGTLELCRGLTTFINTTDTVKVGDNDYSASCSATKLTSELANSFTDENVQFVANNGMKFYITKMLGDEDIHFYIVYVDINGNKRPNSFVYPNANNRDDLPDIYAFAVVDAGGVLPLGIPEYESDILTARFAYFGVDGEILYSRRSMAYYQAKGAAWGYYSDKEDPLDYDESDPFTMNDFVRSKIDANSLIVDGFPDLSSLSPVNSANDEDHRCSNTDTESCYIFLDSYRP